MMTEKRRLAEKQNLDAVQIVTPITISWQVYSGMTVNFF